MKKKLFWRTALKIAKSRGYDGEETFAAVKSWWGDSLISDAGDPVEIVEKEVVVSIAATAGEEVRVEDAGAGDTETEAVGEEDDEEAGEKNAARTHAARTKSHRERQEDAFRKSEVARMTKEASGQVTALMHKRILARKSYDKAAAKGQTNFSGADVAELYGAMVKSVIADRLRLDYAEKQYEHDMLRKNGLTTAFGAGGALVPSVFEAELIKLRETRGNARKLVGVTKMASSSEVRPRRTSGVTVYAQTEGSAVTASNQAYDVIQLTATDWMATSYLSVQLINLSAIDIADETADEHAYAMESQLDQCVFNGDGTSTYFGHVGFREKLKALSGTIANIAGLHVGTGNAYSELVLDDFAAVETLLPEYNFPTEPMWAMSKKVWGQARNEMLDKGGTTSEHVAGGVRRMLLEWGVEVVPVMPKVEANSQVCALFGHFKEAAKIGEVQGSMRFDANEGEKFSQGLVAFRTMQQVAINVHDVGNASATAASREPGPVVGLITAAS